MTQKEIKNLIGKSFDYLTVIEEAPFKETINKNGIYKVRYWKCKCECGNYRIIAHGDLMKNNRTKSCGCKRKETILQKIKDYNIEKYKNLNCTPTELKFYSQYKYSDTVIKNKKSFNLSLETFIKLINEKCYYCGEQPFRIRYALNKKEKQKLNGIDRIDSSKGYEEDNVVSCCTQCNLAKLNYSTEEFLNWIKKVYEYNKL